MIALVSINYGVNAPFFLAALIIAVYIMITLLIFLPLVFILYAVTAIVLKLKKESAQFYAYLSLESLGYLALVLLGFPLAYLFNVLSI